MIFGDIFKTEDMEKIYPAAITKAINYLKSNDFTTFETGRYEIEGGDIFCMVMDTVTKEKASIKPEVHRKFIDIQFLVKGEELMGVARDTGNNIVLEDILEEKDVLFYKNVENEMDITLKPGNFAVFFPFDVHRPGCAIAQETSIRKVVVKIKYDIL